MSNPGLRHMVRTESPGSKGWVTHHSRADACRWLAYDCARVRRNLRNNPAIAVRTLYQHPNACELEVTHPEDNRQNPPRAPRRYYWSVTCIIL